MQRPRSRSTGIEGEMKRGGPLRRKTRLKSKTPLRAKRWARWRKRTVHDWEEMCEYLQERSGGYCERCKEKLGGKVQPQNCHHILARSRGGQDVYDNLACLCAPMNYIGRQDHSCHSWVEANREAARTQGWLK